MCIEIDLTKPLVPEFEVEGHVLSVVYESLGLLCTKCGLFGHMKEGCEEHQRRKCDARMNVEDIGEKGKDVEVTEDDGEENGLRKAEVAREVRPLADKHERGLVKVTVRKQKKKKQGKNVSMMEGKQNLKEAKMEGAGSCVNGDRHESNGRIGGLEAPNKIRGNTGCSKASLQSQGSVECVPETNMEFYRANVVEHCDKENLQPGVQQGRMYCNDDMEMENVRRWADDEELIASSGLGEIKEFTIPALANDK
ncbi:hypothetical protein K1719_012192 [Acacia pycnantha]|nr:hypothetical protein K1719_012192 [Acacia pycnantha]